MRKEVRHFIELLAEYRNYHHAEPVDVVALAALKNRMLKIRKNRVEGGILTNAYDWDFMPQDVQRKAVSFLFYKIGHAWGFDQANAIKLAASMCLIGISPFVKTTVAEIYVNAEGGTFFVHGLTSHL